MRNGTSMGLRYQFAIIFACLMTALLILLAIVLRVIGWGAAEAVARWGWFALVMIVTAFMVGLFAGLSVLRRIQHMREISRAWLRGNLDLRISEQGSDEISEVASSLNQMAQRLEQDEQDIEALRQREARLADQVRALSVLEERNRLARELHDSVKQHLFSLAMTASAVTDRTVADRAGSLPPEVAEMVQQMKTTAQTAQRELTRLIEDLRPAPLAERGLGEVLNEYTLILGAREHLLIYLTVQGNDSQVPLQVAEALYLVAQETLTNVVRHARATRVDARLKILPEQVSLTIRDDGVGFDLSQPRHGIGTTNMQERMTSIGGRICLESHLGQGTTVTAEVSLLRPAVLQSGYLPPDCGQPDPRIERWPWLGQKLVIPVGQTWPWAPADEVVLLRPLIEPNGAPIHLRETIGMLGLGHGVILELGQRSLPSIHIHLVGTGYEWRMDGATWAVREVRGCPGKQVLYRNEQPLAAVQDQGRQMDVWSELIYCAHGYRLSSVDGASGSWTLTDEDRQELLHTNDGGRLDLFVNRAIPLPLLILAALRILEERRVTALTH